MQEDTRQQYIIWYVQKDLERKLNKRQNTVL